MLFSLSLSTLLTIVLIMMSMQVVESMPLVKRNSKFVTIPLKRVEQAGDLHPQIVCPSPHLLFDWKGLTQLILHQRLQQNINRGIRRLARMSGREAPSTSTLEQNLVKRVQAVEGTEVLERRFNRMGTRLQREVLEKRFNRVGTTLRPKANSAASLMSLKGRQAASQPPAVSKPILQPLTIPWDLISSEFFELL